MKALLVFILLGVQFVHGMPEGVMDATGDTWDGNALSLGRYETGVDESEFGADTTTQEDHELLHLSDTSKSSPTLREMCQNKQADSSCSTTTGYCVCPAGKSVYYTYITTDFFCDTYKMSCVSCSSGYYTATSQTGNMIGNWNILTSGNTDDITEGSGCYECSAGTTSNSGAESCTACPSGKTSDAGGSCYSETTCSSGKYVSGSSCLSCPIGQYQSSASTTTITTCTSCSYGLSSSAGSSGCSCSSSSGSGSTTCSPGLYISSGTCTACPGGKYDIGNNLCVNCDIGLYSANAATSCTSCGSGYYAATTGVSACSSCPAGQSTATTGATVCVPCLAGKFAAVGSACTPCGYGTAQPSSGASSCQLCSAGQYAASSASDTSGGLTTATTSPVAEGASSCNNCPAGLFSATASTISCQLCAPTVYSTPGSTVCAICAQNFFLDADLVCSKCPIGADCRIPGASTLQRLTLYPGYWRIAEDSLDINQCVYDGSCKGGLGSYQGYGDNYFYFSYSYYCAPGYTGILCAVCSGGFYFSPDSKECIDCSGGKSPLASPTMVVFLIALIIICIGLGVYVLMRREFATALQDYQQKKVADQADKEGEFKEKLEDTLMDTLITALPTIQDDAKAINSSYQIAVNVGFNCQIQFPLSFQRLLGAFQFVNLDIIPSLGLGCVGTYDFSSKVFVVTLVPLAFAAVLGGIFEFKRRQRHSMLDNGAIEEITLLDSIKGLPDDKFKDLKKIIDQVIDFDSEISKEMMGEIISVLTPNASEDCIGAQVDKLFRTSTKLDKAGVFNSLDAARNGPKPPVDESLLYLSCFLFLTYMVLISTSSTLFRFMSCQEFPVPNQASQHYLYSDYSIDCDTSGYKGVKAYAAIMIIIFPIGIPAMYSTLLWRNRITLNSATAMDVEKVLGFPNTARLSFLISAYKQQYYFFDVIECVRRLFLASVVGLLGAQNSPANAVGGLLVCMVFIWVFMKFEPYKEDHTNNLTVTLSYSLAFIFLAALMAKVTVSSSSDLDTYGGLLGLVFFMGPLVLIFQFAMPYVLPPILKRLESLNCKLGGTETKHFTHATTDNPHGDLDLSSKFGRANIRKDVETGVQMKKGTKF